MTRFVLHTLSIELSIEFFNLKSRRLALNALDLFVPFCLALNAIGYLRSYLGPQTQACPVIPPYVCEVCVNLATWPIRQLSRCS